jgi:hypothetical protein
MPSPHRASFSKEQWLKIVTEAAELSRSIRLSPAFYEFEIDFVPRDSMHSRVLYGADLERYKAVDNASGQPIRGVKNVVIGINGRIGEKLCVIHPALKRRGKSVEKDVVLVPTTILVKLDLPAIPRGKAKMVSADHAHKRHG